MSLRQYCDNEVSLLTQDSSILDAAQVMRKNHVGEVIIIEHQKAKTIPLGIVTDRDLVIEIMAMEVDVEKINLGSIMCFELITVSDDTSLNDALEIMQINGIRRAPVIDGSGALIGLINIESILKILTQDMTKLLKLFNTEKRIEKTRRS